MIRDKLRAMGMDLMQQVYRPPKGNYNLAVRCEGTFIHLSGHIPYSEDGTPIVGLIDDLDGISESTSEKVFGVKRGQIIARSVAVSLLKSLEVELSGDLERVRRIVKMNV